MPCSLDHQPFVVTVDHEKRIDRLSVHEPVPVASIPATAETDRLLEPRSRTRHPAPRAVA